jgi:hypothetical protein
MKTFIKLFICCFFYSIATAQFVSTEIAQQVALNWYNSKVNKVESIRGDANVLREYKVGENNNFYVFGFSQGGFVVVSGDYRAKPILAYSLEGHLPQIINQPAVIEWLGEYGNQIEVLINLENQNNKVDSKWNDLLTNNRLDFRGREIGPLLTTKWNQGWPYNSKCPEDEGGPGGRVWAGCVAVAMAQILKYHNHPAKGFGHFQYEHAHYSVTAADFGATSYDWDNMPDQISEENDAIATLIYHSAISTLSRWGSQETSVIYFGDQDPMTRAFVNYFDFAFDGMRWLTRSNFEEDSIWENILFEELVNGRPVYYRGDGSNGHAWVCDGVDHDNYFHFNWGWGGQMDGYFSLNTVRPGIADFSYNHNMIIGLRPNDGSTINVDTLWDSEMIFNKSIAIADNAKVRVNPGAVLKFKEDSRLQVFGQLEAIGEEDNLIKFTASDPEKGWDGIKWENGFMNQKVMADNDTSRLIYAQIEFSNFHGVYCFFYDKVVIDRCIFNNNDSGSNRGHHNIGGGAICAYWCGATIVGSKFYENTASGGSAIRISSWGAKVDIRDNEIFNNSGQFGTVFIGYGDINISNNLIYNNFAGFGSGLMLRGFQDPPEPKVFNNKFLNNISSHLFWDGVIYVEGRCNPIFSNNLIANNRGSAFSILHYSHPKLLNNTIVNNFARSESGSAINLRENSSVFAQNNIIYNNLSSYWDNGEIKGTPDYQIMVDATSDVNFRSNNLLLGIDGFDKPDHLILDETRFINNIDADPRFRTPSEGIGSDFDGFSANWKLTVQSPCINAGDTIGISSLISEIDLDGNPRMDNLIDIGAYEFQFNMLPGIPGPISGDTKVCAPELVEYSVPELENVISYLWTLPDGVQGSSSSNVISLEFTDEATSGNLKVQGVNEVGVGEPATIFIEVVSTPSTPIINQTGNILSSNAEHGNQWYHNDSPILDAIGQELEVTESGDYYVIVSTLGCSSAPSNVINVLLSGTMDDPVFKNLKLFPNSFQNHLIIELPNNDRLLNVEIYNSFGQLIIKDSIITKLVMNTENLPSGQYYLKLSDEKSFITKKIMKM